MACIKKNKLENGMVSYRIQVKAKNERTGKFQTKVITWRKPPELNEKSVQRELNKIAGELLFHNNGEIRTFPVQIGGTSWCPEMPQTGTQIIF